MEEVQREPHLSRCFLTLSADTSKPGTYLNSWSILGGKGKGTTQQTMACAAFCVLPTRQDWLVRIQIYEKKIKRRVIFLRNGYYMKFTFQRP